MPDHYLVHSDEEHFSSIPLCGHKASAFARLRDHAMTPPSLALTTEAFDAFVSRNKIPITESREGANPAVELESAVLNGVLPPEIRAAIAQIAQHFAGQLIAVRSSSLGEDDARGSAAGVFHSQIGIPARPVLVEKAIRRVWASVFSPAALQYAQLRNPRARVTMAVLIQPVIEAVASGVAFSIDPVSGSGMLIEAVPGLAMPLVDGMLVPDRFQLTEDGRVEREVVEKQLAYVVARDWYRLRAGDPITWQCGDRNVRAAFLKYVAGGIAAIRIADAAFAQRSVLGDAEIIEVEETARKLARALNYPVDVEWALAQDALYVLQARPITQPSRAADSNAAIAGRKVWKGKGLAGGVARGRIVKATVTPEDKSAILATHEISPARLNEVLLAEAVITGRGGVLSHIAILCRELGKPCVQLAAYRDLRSGMNVLVDGHQGIISLLDPEEVVSL